MFTRTLASLCLTLAMSQCANAQLTAMPCSATEQRQFDFWIGHWDVFTPDGKKAGENLVELVAQGCALMESWSGSGGLTGKSLNSWDRRTRRWRQHWVDSSGGLLQLEGQWAEGRMVLHGQQAHPRDMAVVVHQRITWTPASDGSVHQLWERSVDNQRSWTPVFDGRYVKRR